MDRARGVRKESRRSASRAFKLVSEEEEEEEAE